MIKNGFYPHPQSPSGITSETFSIEEAEKEWRGVVKWAGKCDPPLRVKWVIYDQFPDLPQGFTRAEWSPEKGEIIYQFPGKNSFSSAPSAS
jgi:hypothetical protein